MGSKLSGEILGDQKAMDFNEFCNIFLGGLKPEPKNISSFEEFLEELNMEQYEKSANIPLPPQSEPRVINEGEQPILLPETTTNFVSLYDYLGKAGGRKLGEQVFSYSKRAGAKRMSKFIEQGGYSGQVMCYNPIFLDEYFDAKKRYDVDTKYFG
jgi:hypothetical protein